MFFMRERERSEIRDCEIEMQRTKARHTRREENDEKTSVTNNNNNNNNNASSRVQDGAAEEDTCDGVQNGGRGFSGGFDTDPRGGVRYPRILSHGLGYSAQAYLEIYYPGTCSRMTHTITHVRVRYADGNRPLLSCK